MITLFESSGTIFLKAVALILSLSLAQTSLAADNDANKRVTLQEALNYFGFPAGPPDGIWGRKTHKAIRIVIDRIFQLIVDC